MKSMTGFGVGRVPLGQGRLVVELRSVNHRFLDVRVRAPRELMDLSMLLEQMARQRFKRGRFELVLRADGALEVPASLDVQRAKALYKALCELRDEIAPDQPVPFSMLASIPELFVGEGQDHRKVMIDALERSFDQAVQAAEAMRSQEGEALARDLTERLATVRQHVDVLASRRLEMVESFRRRFRDRVQRLLDDVDVTLDPARLEQEVAIAADRCDVEEEITRLHSHFDQFAFLCQASEPVGRRLDFLLQEMAREVNTIGSKSQDAPVAHAVVEIKAEIGRMREQVQNVE